MTDASWGAQHMGRDAGGARLGEAARAGRPRWGGCNTGHGNTCDGSGELEKEEEQLFHLQAGSMLNSVCRSLNHSILVSRTNYKNGNILSNQTQIHNRSILDFEDGAISSYLALQPKYTL